jgi:hypothetical protein
MSADVVATMRDGLRLEFTRRKARNDTISGAADSQQIDANELGRLLGNLDLESYEHLFGFSQEVE